MPTVAREPLHLNFNLKIIIHVKIKKSVQNLMNTMNYKCYSKKFCVKQKLSFLFWGCVLWFSIHMIAPMQKGYRLIQVKGYIHICMLSLQKMELMTWVQILDKAVCVSLHTNSLEKVKLISFFLFPYVLYSLFHTFLYFLSFFLSFILLSSDRA